jgi:hypothetical protein
LLLASSILVYATKKHLFWKFILLSSIFTIIFVGAFSVPHQKLPPIVAGTKKTAPEGAAITEGAPPFNHPIKA